MLTEECLKITCRRLLELNQISRAVYILSDQGSLPYLIKQLSVRYGYTSNQSLNSCFLPDKQSDLRVLIKCLRSSISVLYGCYQKQGAQESVLKHKALVATFALLCEKRCISDVAYQVLCNLDSKHIAVLLYDVSTRELMLTALGQTDAHEYWHKIRNSIYRIYENIPITLSVVNFGLEFLYKKVLLTTPQHFKLTQVQLAFLKEHSNEVFRYLIHKQYNLVDILRIIFDGPDAHYTQERLLNNFIYLLKQFKQEQSSLVSYSESKSNESNQLFDRPSENDELVDLARLAFYME